MIIEPDLITFPTYKIYPDLDIGELEEEIYSRTMAARCIGL